MDTTQTVPPTIATTTGMQAGMKTSVRRWPQGGPDGHGEWHKGDRLAHDYRDRQYVVDDWRGYGLHQPPRGYQ